jgi:Domain of unknown function (DUF4214)
MMMPFREFLSLDSEGFVKAAYRFVLGREADPGGFDSHVSRLLIGIDRIALLYDLAESSEARQALGPYTDLSKLDDEAFVEALYFRLLKRRADPLGKLHYLGVIRGTEGRRSAVREIEASEEFAARNPQSLSFLRQFQEVMAMERRRRSRWRGLRGDRDSERKLNQLLEAVLTMKHRKA